MLFRNDMKAFALASNNSIISFVKRFTGNAKTPRGMRNKMLMASCRPFRRALLRVPMAWPTCVSAMTAWAPAPSPQAVTRCSSGHQGLAPRGP